MIEDAEKEFLNFCNTFCSSGAETSAFYRRIWEEAWNASEKHTLENINKFTKFLPLRQPPKFYR